MRSRDLVQRRPQKPKLLELLRQHSSLQVIVGAMAIAAIVLAFASRSGEAPQAAGAVPGPTLATAAMAAPPTAVPSPSPQQERIHVVASGDTLTGLAQKYYSDASKWEKIFEANRDVLPSANALQVGQKLKIPD
ncbi:MAG: LysM peptidoglycan-binding domain-containing protein [Sphingomonadaceae bacterium]